MGKILSSTGRRRAKGEPRDARRQEGFVVPFLQEIRFHGSIEVRVGYLEEVAKEGFRAVLQWWKRTHAPTPDGV